MARPLEVAWTVVEEGADPGLPLEQRLLRYCTGCHDHLPLMAFGYDRKVPKHLLGRAYYCRDCRAVRDREWACSLKVRAPERAAARAAQQRDYRHAKRRSDPETERRAARDRARVRAARTGTSAAHRRARAQAAILDAITRYYLDHKASPDLRLLCVQVGMCHRTVLRHVRALVAEGYLLRLGRYNSLLPTGQQIEMPPTGTGAAWITPAHHADYEGGDEAGAPSSGGGEAVVGVVDVRAAVSRSAR